LEAGRFLSVWKLPHDEFETVEGFGERADEEAGLVLLCWVRLNSDTSMKKVMIVVWLLLPIFK
jgi:hypothetical protein